MRVSVLCLLLLDYDCAVLILSDCLLPQLAILHVDLLSLLPFENSCLFRQLFNSDQIAMIHFQRYRRHTSPSLEVSQVHIFILADNKHDFLLVFVIWHWNGDKEIWFDSNSDCLPCPHAHMHCARVDLTEYLGTAWHTQ